MSCSCDLDLLGYLLLPAYIISPARLQNSTGMSPSADIDEAPKWPVKTSEFANHHMDSTRWNDFPFVSARGIAPIVSEMIR